MLLLNAIDSITNKFSTQSQYSIPQQYDYSMFDKILLLSASYSVTTQCYVEFHNSKFYVILLLKASYNVTNECFI